jgi:hypothetical protein
MPWQLLAFVLVVLGTFEAVYLIARRWHRRRPSVTAFVVTLALTLMALVLMTSRSISRDGASLWSAVVAWSAGITIPLTAMALVLNDGSAGHSTAMRLFLALVLGLIFSCVGLLVIAYIACMTGHGCL